MTDPATLRALLARVENATGEDRDIDELIGLHVPGAAYSVTGDYGEPMVAGLADRYTASVDAALALVERVLPGAHWSVTNASIKPRAIVWAPSSLRAQFADPYSRAFTPALALLAALLRAKIAETDQ